MLTRLLRCVLHDRDGLWLGAGVFGVYSLALLAIGLYVGWWLGGAQPLGYP